MRLMALLPHTTEGLLIAALLSPFIMIATGLSIVRFGLGLSGAGMGVVILLLSGAVALSAPISTEFENVGGYDAVANNNPQAIAIVTTQLKAKLVTKETDLKVLLKEYAIYQFVEACKLGVAWLVPFVVIDVLILHAGGLLGVAGLSATALGLCIKLLLFLSVEGMTKVTEKLLSGAL